MLLHEFLKNANVNERLRRFFAEALTAGVVRIRQAIENGNTAHVGTENASGEEQIGLDVQSNNILVEVFKNSGLVAQVASEEEETLVDGTPGGDFAVAF